MKRLLPFLGCLALLLLTGCADKTAEALPAPTPLASETPHIVILSGTPEPVATATPEPTAEPVDHIGQSARDNMLLQISTLKLVGFKGAILLYQEASEQGENEQPPG